MVTETRPQAKSTWVVDPTHTSIEFAAKHMVIATVKGRFTKYEVDFDFNETAPERSHVAAHMEVASIDTREPQRDAHLRSPDFFDAERYPAITFTSRRIEPRGGNGYTVVGDMTIRDVTREVVLDAEFAGLAKDPWGNQRAGLAIEGKLNRKDFGLTWNVALETGGFVVGDTIKLSIEAELIKQQ